MCDKCSSVVDLWCESLKLASLATCRKLACALCGRSVGHQENTRLLGSRTLLQELGMACESVEKFSLQNFEAG